MKKLFIVSLVWPLLVTGFLYSCLCPMADAAVAAEPVFQSSHACCCPELSMPQDPLILENVAYYQTSSNEKTIGLVPVQPEFMQNNNFSSEFSPQSHKPPSKQLSSEKEVLRT